jgi:hypothetical protein
LSPQSRKYFLQAKMRREREQHAADRILRRSARGAVPIARTARGRFGTRARGKQRSRQAPFSPPEDWHEPSGPRSRADAPGFKTIVQPAGRGFRHVVKPSEIRDRLAKLPSEFVAPLEVVQLSRMTRKKALFSCYGMQWGNSIYLYPLEEDRIERHGRPPKPAHLQEAKTFGGKWIQVAGNEWHLIWSESALKDFYLNNILIHELGHLLDRRNASYGDREAFAEWFALEYGYSTGQRRAARRRTGRPARRHHRR